MVGINRRWGSGDEKTVNPSRTLASNQSANNDGYGQLCAVIRDRSRLSSSATTAKRLAAVYGKRFPKRIAVVKRSAISGKRMPPCFQGKCTIQWGKKVVKRLIWSDGTIPCDNVLGSVRARQFHFPRPIIITLWLHVGLSLITICNCQGHRLPINHCRLIVFYFLVGAWCRHAPRHLFAQLL